MQGDSSKVNAYIEKTTTTTHKRNNSSFPLTKSGESPRLYNPNNYQNSTTAIIDMATSDLPLPDTFPIPNRFD